MLTFLRKIRRSLIELGSARKYLLYAIGEIVLVVIGILIALQVNNQNEQRKQSKLADDSLKRLVQDLRNDQRAIQYLDSILQLNSVVSDSALSLLNAAFNAEDFKKIAEMPNYSVLIFSVNQSTYDEMVNTGLLYSIKNKELIGNINMYNTTVSRVESSIKFANEVIIERALVTDMAPLLIAASQINRNEFDFNRDYSWLRNAESDSYQAIESFIRFIISTSEAFGPRINSLLVWSEHLIQEIENELDE